MAPGKNIVGTFVFTLSLLMINPIDASVVKNPPVGSFPTHDLKAGFLFKNSGEIFIPGSVHYDGGGTITLSSFPNDRVLGYFMVNQETTPEEGALLVKVKRTYRTKVMRDRRGTVKLWVGRGFYQKAGTFSVTWNKTEKRNECNFSMTQYEDYSKGIDVDGINAILSVYWDENDKCSLRDESIREKLEFADDSEIDKSLFSCGFIHFTAFSGVRWLPIEIPVAGEAKNLEEIFVDVLIIKGSNIKPNNQYWLRDE